jgi:hypothetical protein
MKSVPLDLLKPMTPYKIVRVRGNEMVAILPYRRQGRRNL